MVAKTDGQMAATIAFPYVYGENVEGEYPDVTVNIERITPDTAKKMLTTNIKNRRIKSAPLDTLEGVMNGEEFTLNGESVIFSKTGRLMDGQHRLTSCIKTGKTIDVVVVRGVEDDSQDTIDSGARRSLSDYVKMDGYKNYVDVAAIGKILARKDDIGITSRLFDNNVTKRSTKALRKFINENHDERIEPLIPQIRLVTNRYKGIPIHHLGALFDEFRKAGDDNFTEFVAQLTGRSAACMPVRLLQNKFAEHATSTGQGKHYYRKSVLAAYIVKAWNAYMRGDEMKRLTFNPGGKNAEKFPEVFLGYE